MENTNETPNKSEKNRYAIVSAPGYFADYTTVWATSATREEAVLQARRMSGVAVVDGESTGGFSKGDQIHRLDLERYVRVPHAR